MLDGEGQGGGMGGQFYSVRWVYKLNMSHHLGLKPSKEFAVGEGWWWMVKRHYRVPLYFIKRCQKNFL